MRENTTLFMIQWTSGGGKYRPGPRPPLFDFAHVSTPSAEQDMERKLRLHELEDVRVRLERFIGSGLLTEIQKRRFYLYCIRNLSIRKIARAEGVRQFAVWKSLNLCQKKFSSFLKRQGGHPPT